MTRKFLSAIAMVLLGAILLSACGLFGSGTGETTVSAPEQQQIQNTPELATAEPPTATPTPACYNEYMPVREGATWNYSLSGSATDTVNRRILTVATEAFSDRTAFTSGLTRDTQWQCRSGNLIALNPPSGNFASINEEGIWLNYSTTELNGVTIPNALQPGSTWQQTMTIEGTQSIYNVEYKAKNKISNNCTAIGIEALTVAAGTFETVKTECNLVVEVSLSIQDKPNQVTLTFKNTNWYARNVGLVKSTTVGEDINTTLELLSYSIP